MVMLSEVVTDGGFLLLLLRVVVRGGRYYLLSVVVADVGCQMVSRMVVCEWESLVTDA